MAELRGHVAFQKSFLWSAVFLLKVGGTWNSYVAAIHHGTRFDELHLEAVPTEQPTAQQPGGTMAYSTCTLNPEENEAMVRFALDTYKCLHLVPAEPRVGGPGACVHVCMHVCVFWLMC